MSSAIERIKELQKKRQEVEKAIAEEGKALFQEATTGLFQEFPALDYFAWKQYTPYFNDGDECVFQVNTDYIDLSVGGVLNEDFGRLDLSHRWEEKKNQQQIMGAKIFSLLDAFSEADYKIMFGDHVEVKVSRDGLTVDEYEHD